MTITDLLNSALGLHRKGQLTAAITLYQRALNLEPNNFDALHLLGACFLQSGEIEKAVSTLRVAIDLVPTSAVALSNLGAAQKSLGLLRDARINLEKAISLDPDLYDAWINLGNVYSAMTAHEQAVKCYDFVLDKRPNHPTALMNRAISLTAARRDTEADYDLSTLLVGEPRNRQALQLSGAIKLKLGQAAVAVDRFQAALVIDSNSAELWSHLGRAYLDLRKTTAAETAFLRAIALQTDNVDSRVALGHLELQRNNPAGAIQHYAIAYKKDPKRNYLPGYLLFAKLNACDWTAIDALTQSISARISADECPSTPFFTLAAFDSLPLQKKCATNYSKKRYSNTTQFTALIPRQSIGRVNKKIRLGYFSADLFDHATCRLMHKVFELHDRNRFEIHGFTFSPRTGDEMQIKVESTFDKLHDISKISDADAARLSRSMGLNVAIDLKGYTKDCRPGIFAERCAPIQLSFLGYPGTMGAAFIDYIVADDVIAPESLSEYYTEKIIRLDTCYQPNSPLETHLPTVSRREFGLPENAFVYCSFNQQYKILPETFSTWMSVLSQVPRSVLWLYTSNDEAKGNLAKEIRSRGVDPGRIIWANRVDHPTHISRQRLGDLFLDTFPYNAHTTASDALRMGLPVLTRFGETFASRVSTSLLSTLDMPELIASDLGAFERLAVELGTRPEKIDSVKRKLRRKVLESPLFDAAYFTRLFENKLFDLIQN